MAELEHVVKTFSLLETAEKEQPFLTREQKQDLYRIAFHKESMEEVEKIILQLQAPHAGKEEKERILYHYLEPFSQVPENILQIENYIFQLQYMTYEKEKAADAFVILDPTGFGMAVIAMSVVFVALIFLYLVFRTIGKLNTAKAKKNALLKQGKVVEASKISDDAPGDVYAAISMALHLYQSQLHDDENTVITMEKVARNYSPWSSKIYGLRQYNKN